MRIAAPRVTYARRVAMFVRRALVVGMLLAVSPVMSPPAYAAPASGAVAGAIAVETTVALRDLPTDAVAYARPGEGVIRITARVCGSAANWRSVAAANGITAQSSPPYLVRLGQRLTVPCSGGVARAVPAAPAAGGWVAPVNACIVSGYGWRGTRMHYGIDLAAGYGTPIRAAHGGIVTVKSQPSGAGNYTVVNHGGGLYTVYMHQSRWAVTSGWVNAGQIIGYVGATGNASGPHLHFEVHTGGLFNRSAQVDPAAYMANRGVHWRRC